MAGLKALIQKIEKIDVRQLAADAVEQTKESIIEINQSQMAFGEDSEGKIIGRYNMITEEGKYYAAYKHELNPNPGFGIMDFRLTGAFWEAMYVEVKEDVIEIGSHDEKTGSLLRRNNKIFGLTDDSRKYYVRVVLKPEAFSELKKRLK